MKAADKFIDKIIFDAKVSERKILLIPTETIVSTPYNPPSRTREGAAMKRLVESVKKYGVIQPLVITADRDLCDGNRRLHAAKAAGMDFVECIILPIHLDKDEVFRTVNTTPEKIGGKGWLEACRRGYKTPPPNIWAQYQELFGLVGTYGIDLMIEKKLGFNLLEQCKSVKALGLSERLDGLIIKVAQRRLTNKLNAIYRSDIDRAEKVKQITELLK
jgi:hypothetical protein